MTIERHFAIVDPLGYDSSKVRRRLPYVFVGSWLFVLGALVGFVPYSTTIIGDGCIIAYKMQRRWTWDYYGGHAVAVAIGIPMTVMVVCYTRMILALRESTTTLHAGNDVIADVKSNNVHKLRLAQMNIFKTCLLMIGFFLTCWLTKDAALILYIMGVYDDTSNAHWSVGQLLILMNSCFNPYIYFIRYEEFKTQLRRITGSERTQPTTGRRSTLTI